MGSLPILWNTVECNNTNLILQNFQIVYQNHQIKSLPQVDFALKQIPQHQSQLSLFLLNDFFCEIAFLFCILFCSPIAALQDMIEVNIAALQIVINQSNMKWSSLILCDIVFQIVKYLKEKSSRKGKVLTLIQFWDELIELLLTSKEHGSCGQEWMLIIKQKRNNGHPFHSWTGDRLWLTIFLSSSFALLKGVVEHKMQHLW